MEIKGKVETELAKNKKIEIGKIKQVSFGEISGALESLVINGLAIRHKEKEHSVKYAKL